jgi:hypothetical protein
MIDQSLKRDLSALIKGVIIIENAREILLDLVAKELYNSDL